MILPTSFWYLATPYSKYADGLEAAFTNACKVAATLVRAGVPVYSPIAHTHPIAMHGGLDPLYHRLWLAMDRPLMDAANGLIVVRMRGWEVSHGITEEIKVFEEAGKPILYMEWNDEGE